MLCQEKIEEVKPKGVSEGLLNKIKEQLDSIPSIFVQPKFLHKIGIFGSHSAAINAVKNGELPCVKVSPYRVLIQKEDVISFLKEKYHEKNK